MILRQWFHRRLPNPRSSIKSDVSNLIISFIYEYYIKYGRFVTVIEVWEMFKKHPSIKNNKEYQRNLLRILGNCEDHTLLYLDTAHNIIQIKPE